MWGWGEDTAFGPSTQGTRAGTATEWDPVSTNKRTEKALSCVIDYLLGMRRVQIHTWGDPIYLNTCTVGKGWQVWTWKLGSAKRIYYLERLHSVSSCAAISRDFLTWGYRLTPAGTSDIRNCGRGSRKPWVWRTNSMIPGKGRHNCNKWF